MNQPAHKPEGGHPKIVIEADIPMPDGNFAMAGVYESLRSTLKDMKAGQSFVWDENGMIYRAAKEAGVKIKARKINGSGYRIWKVKDL